MNEEQPEIQKAKAPRLDQAQKLASVISPLISEMLEKGAVSFVGLSVVIDDKRSITFPFLPVASSEATEKEIDEINARASKAILLAAVEYARTAGVLKARAIQALEHFFEQ